VTSPRRAVSLQTLGDGSKEAGVHPNVSALVYVAARAPDADEDYTALAKTYPTPPATAGIVFEPATLLRKIPE
jgi:hypothetical protein